MFHFQARKFITGPLLIGIAYEMHSPLILASLCCSLTSSQVDGVQLKRMKGAQRQHEWWNLSFTASPVVIKEDSHSFFGGIRYADMQMHETLLLQPTTPRLYSLAPSSFRKRLQRMQPKKRVQRRRKGSSLIFLMTNFHQ